MRIITFLMILSLVMFSFSPSFGQSAKPPSFGISAMVSKGDDSKEVNSELTFQKDKLTVESDKSGKYIKEFAYTDIKSADYSYSKKPMWKTGVVSALFLGPFAAPFFFIRKKSHWMTISTGSDFVVLKLEYKNYKKIIRELEARNIEVEMLDKK